jgi:hypothetical protein
MWLGGPYNGQLNQYGGSAQIGLLHLYSGGAYNCYGGEQYLTNIYFYGGTVFIRGGIRYQPIEPGDYVQTGGTNYGPIGFNYYSYGMFTLSNGVSCIPDLSLGQRGNYVQYGGRQTVTGLVTSSYDVGGFRSSPTVGAVSINGGIFEASGMSLGGRYTQAGGTTTIHGEITIDGALARIQLNGGVLMDRDVIVFPSYGNYELSQSGGLHIISNQLTINGAHGVSLAPGARMMVSNITILNGVLSIADQTLTQCGRLTCNYGNILVGEGSHQLGSLQLSGPAALTLPPNSNCIVHFRDSRTAVWADTLIITNWSGNVSGGGIHQILFGNSATAFASSQLHWIRFQDPGGSPGIYEASMLSTGEIVPAARPTVSLTPQPGQTLLVELPVTDGSRYWIETSIDLLHWSFWTNSNSSGGVLSVMDTQTNAAQKFYRAVLLPW